MLVKFGLWKVGTKAITVDVVGLVEYQPVASFIIDIDTTIGGKIVDIILLLMLLYKEGSTPKVSKTPKRSRKKQKTKPPFCQNVFWQKKKISIASKK